MRVRPALPQRDRAVSPVWFEPGSDDQLELEGLETQPGAGTGTPANEFQSAHRQDRAGAFSERFAVGTGQYELPRPELHGSPDEPISSIMTSRVVCARPEMDAALLRARLIERGVSGAPVVDDWGHVLGVVSKSDLVEHEVTGERGHKTVSDIMMTMVFTLPADAPIAKAAALMAYEGVHRIVVVDERRCVVGVLSALDIARWLGSSAGYSVGREP
jgi:CBS-domain-containing membrane protein